MSGGPDKYYARARGHQIAVPPVTVHATRGKSASVAGRIGRDILEGRVERNCEHD